MFLLPPPSRSPCFAVVSNNTNPDLIGLRSSFVEVDNDRPADKLETLNHYDFLNVTVRAAVCRNPGKPLVIEEIEVEPPHAWEIRIKILCTSLCHSDITFWEISTVIPFTNSSFAYVVLAKTIRSSLCSPLGTIRSFPQNFWARSCRVIQLHLPHVPVLVPCSSLFYLFCIMIWPVFGGFKSCRECRRARGGSRRRGYGGASVSSELQRIFSEYTVVDVVNVVKISPDIPVDKACLLSCGVSTGIGAAWKVADIEEGSTVAIFGLGAVGLAVIKEITDGGADYCFECIGLSSLMEDAFHCTRQGWGKTVILGVEKHATPLSIDTYFLLRGRTVAGSLFGGLKPKSDIPMLAHKYLNKELNLDGFITHQVSFQDINKAFDLLLQGTCIRCIIWMD
ncbi:hypothetical protein V6N13_040090 [Hibiscus sabdariffa]